ncbi:isopenicillin N synthase family oxygenase [Streptomyces sp. WMMC500]|uniref:2-oxoglutarate and iron-dependent oxygenase domain-containing protein n=1 Tax=Streptomyces sp. WMMC500 TaxID=3015154 RepID=UPI00248B730D|nr:2-oxoglutarate and iron-dependent oxygenase domain-containing protein [Streptomyces sp. WMMC500]WBB58583.1 isopenicillin N synthase family oxygenase [Streptomyces sp. WMMC500]
MSNSPVDLVDLGTWRSGGPDERRQLLDRLDASLRGTGFVMVTGHGVDPALRAAVRAAARTAFALPPDVKAGYANEGDGGWTRPGGISAGAVRDAESPPDLVELWSFYPHHPGVWPAEVPALREPVEEYLRQMRRLSRELLELLAAALGEPSDFLTRYDTDAAWQCTINWYGSRQQTGTPRPGQFRLGAHQDWDLMAVLDRQHGQGCLQVRTDPSDAADAADPEDGWEDAPYHPEADALTVNLGELGAMWSGGRWQAGWHRVLPPPADAPAEQLMSLVWFYNPGPDTPMPPAAEARGESSATVGAFLDERLQAILLS